MGVEIKFSQSYLWLDSWVMANIILLATRNFCNRFVDHNIDPGRRLYDQMVMAARSGVANIAEGSSRHSTSIETEMRLLDVARGSFDELQGDYFSFLLQRKSIPWSIGTIERETIWKTTLDRPDYSTDILHDSAIHILSQKKKFDPWIENENADIAANSLLVLCLRINRMLHYQLNGRLEQFKLQGGFSENMTATRMQSKREQAGNMNAPSCPLCGKPMWKRMQKRGQNQGREFWGCSDYPKCTGTRPIQPQPN